MDRNKFYFILFTLVLCSFYVVDSVDMTNSTLSTVNNKTPVVPQSNVTNNEKREMFNAGEIDVSEAMNICNESYKIPISMSRYINTFH